MSRRQGWGGWRMVVVALVWMGWVTSACDDGGSPGDTASEADAASHDGVTDTAADDQVGPEDGLFDQSGNDVVADVLELATEDAKEVSDIDPTETVDVAPDWVEVEVSDVHPDESGGCIDTYPGQILITEIMPAPYPAEDSLQFVEIYNAGFEALQMTGWEVADGAGNTAALDLPESVSFEPGEYLVLGFQSGAGVEGFEVDLNLVGLSLDSKRISVTGGNVLIDAVDWNEGDWPLSPGASMSLVPGAYVFNLNDVPENWCLGVASFFQNESGTNLGTPGVANPECAEPAGCGNEIVEDGEDCDDGANGNGADGCTDSCTFTCSDPDMDCEDTPGDCQVPVCQTNALGQVCVDQPADTDVPESPAECQTVACQDGTVEYAPMTNGITCEPAAEHPKYCVEGACVLVECGDGVKGASEGCDDGNLQDGDGCSGTCTFELCGNGILDEGEDCDDGDDGDDDDGCTDLCGFTCTQAAQDCTDEPGDCQTPVCEPGGEGQICGTEPLNTDVPQPSAVCKVVVCEMGVPQEYNAQDGLPCDNTTGVLGDYCVGGMCLDPLCGDGIEGVTEDCDDGNLDECDGCLSNCTSHTNVCGDGLTCPGEECDDANSNSCDGCLNTCVLHENFCGDAYLCGDEQCDDGNNMDGDGCSSVCQLEDETGCPDDMVEIPANEELGIAESYCMDRYEASRTDASSSNQGSAETMAMSVAGVMPWYVNPFDPVVHLPLFEAACQAAGKRLCTPDEWYVGCAGTNGSNYVWGNSWERETCNSVDAFCDDFCLSESIPMDECNLNQNCGYSYYCFHATPTGAFESCVNEFGAYDVNGNVWEIVPTTSGGYQIRGGAFNCGSPAARLQCTYTAGWTSLYAGFRCCK